MSLFETHVPVARTDVAQQFYCDVVGLTFACRAPTRDIVFLWIGPDRQHTLGLWGPRTAHGEHHHKHHFALAVTLPELLAAGERLRSLGVATHNFFGEPTTEPSVIGWMPSAQIYFHDPDGHSLEYITLLDEPPEDRFIGSLSSWRQRRPLRPTEGVRLRLRPIRVTERIEARPAVPTDVRAWADLVRRNADHLRPYLPAVVAIDSAERVRAHLARVAGQAARGEVLEWFLSADGVLCGALRLNKIEPENRKVSIGYLLDADHQGRGIATLAVRALLNYCFDEVDMNRVELTCATDNAGSIGVAERAGFVREGVLRRAERLGDRFADHYVYGLLRSDWHALQVG